MAVPSRTTATDLVTANPDGTVTLSRALSPTRRKVNGEWKDLDPTLERNSDGTLSPRVATADIVFSAGGSGPAATMRHEGRTVKLTTPVSLPAPVLDGDTAVYPSILAGVDLRLRADRNGEVTQVLVVHDRAAATNPKVAAFALTVTSTDVTLRADGGGLRGVDRLGTTVLTSPQSLMWDSTTPDPAQTDALPTSEVASTPDGPGIAAQTAAVATEVAGSTLTLRPDPDLLSSPDTVYPLYIDPTFVWSSTGPVKKGWASVSDRTPSTNRWLDSYDPNDDLQVGKNEDTFSRSMILFPIPVSTLTGANIYSAFLKMSETRSYSCNARQVNVYAPTKNLTDTNATWTYWDGVALGSDVANANVAHGYPGCAADWVSFDVTTTIRNDVNAKLGLRTFVLKANNESDFSSYKEFDETSPTLEIKYNHKPAKPSNLATNPATDCKGGQVGLGKVTLYAWVSDADGNTLGVDFKVWKTIDTGKAEIYGSDPQTLTYGSNTTAQLDIPKATLDTVSAGQPTQFSWTAVATDFGPDPGDVSATCTFTYDPTRPGVPNVTSPTGAVVGTPIKITVTKPDSGTTPTGYLYQLNASSPGQVLDDDSDGTVTVTVTPTRRTNTLTVASLSAGGNISITAASVVFDAAAQNAAADSDLTGDNVADLVAVGGTTTGLPSGVWLAAGRNTGQVNQLAANIGANGIGQDTTAGPASFDGAAIVTGHFTGNGQQDVLAYKSTTGSGAIITGNGDGSTLQVGTGYQYNIDDGALADQGDDPATGDRLSLANPVQVANAHYLASDCDDDGTADAADPYDDLLTISGGEQVGSPPTTRPYHLSHLCSISTNAFMTPRQLTTEPPLGEAWQDWTIATAQAPVDANGTLGTWMFLWRKTDGAIYLWKNLSLATGTLTYTSYTLRASGWNTGKSLGLRAADVNGDTVPDLWTVGAGSSITASIVTGLPTTPNISNGTPAPLITAQHAWTFNDVAGTNVTSSRDIAGNLPMTGTGTVTWNTGDQFSPDIRFADGNTNGTLSTATPAVSTNADFTITAWIKPTATGGTIVSQDDTATAGLKIWAESTDNSWRFALSRSNTGTQWDTAAASANSVQLGTWTLLTATFSKATGAMTLYVNGIKAGVASHSTTWTTTGGFRVGAHRIATGASAASFGGYLTGQLSTVQTWNQVVDPAEARSAAAYYVPVSPTLLMDTRTGLGGTTGPVAPATNMRLKIAGATLSTGSVPANYVASATLTLTAIAVTGSAWAVAYPDNTPRPLTSNLNWSTGETIANTVVVPVGANGYVDLYTCCGGTTHFLVSIVGYHTTDPAATGISTYNPLTAKRILNSISGTGHTGKVASGEVVNLPVTGTTTGVPSDAAAVAITLTATNVANANGFLITYAYGDPRPSTVSGLQYAVGSSRAILAIVQVKSGMISIYNQTGSIDLLGDIVGYFKPGTSGYKYHSMAAARLVDTRVTNDPITAATARPFAQPAGAIATAPVLIMNVTVTQPTANGYAVVYPNATTRQPTSDINWNTGQTRAALAQTQALNGSIDIYNSSGTTHYILDCIGYYAID
ncbi:LamG-like jellyroll fold domain-containing protein [Hamadaea sp. NPDC051192]|uniref:LamG-like jellyroll fold domain-containing protein n=1 Tax=Hamadaea sp. NPDC051192 TaxID=3154940 RepID=UPI003421F0E2